MIPSPGSDFYSYVNDAWQHRVHMPVYEDSYNISNEVEDNVNRELLKCIESHTRTQPTHPLSILVGSIIHGHGNNIEDLKAQLQRLTKLRTDNDIGNTIGYLNSLQCSSPIHIAIRTNCHGHCCVYIGEPVLGLPEHINYSHSETVAKYKSYLSSLGKLFDISLLDTVYATEHRFAASVFDGRGDEGRAYHFSQLCSKYPNIPWSAIMEGYGFKDEIHTRVEYRISNVDYIQQLNADFSAILRPAWIRWLQSMLLFTFVEHLPVPYSDLHFEFYSHFLKGTLRKLPRHIYLLRILNDYVPQLLGSVCISAVSSKDIKDRVTEMVKYLKLSTCHRISNSDWLHAKTRRKALEKAKAMLFQVGYPSHWTTETDGVILTPERLLTNLFSITHRETERMIDDLRANNCGRDTSVWIDSPFIVNAYYYSDKNMLMIPAGSLRPPFFDRRRSLAWNLGGIGSVIGHEISHGFDDDGRLYDARGYSKNWWLPQDDKLYHSYVRRIIKLFDGIPYMGGVVSGKRTLDENIADLCGVSISLGALNERLKTHTNAERLRAYRDFFTSYATSWRTKMRPKKALISLRTSEHAPAKLRVNCIVKQFDEFYEAYGIKAGDVGWVDPSERIRIW